MLMRIQHAERVLRILKLDGLIDGLFYCDYQLPDFSCKPEAEYYLTVSTNQPRFESRTKHSLGHETRRCYGSFQVLFRG